MSGQANKRRNPINRISKGGQYAIILLILLLLGSGTVFFFYRTFTTTGDDAVAVMNNEEREMLDRVLSIGPKMDPSEVYRLLGEPTSDLLVIAQWDGFAGSVLSRGRIYFIDGKPGKFRWIKLGYFVYEVKY